MKLKKLAATVLAAVMAVCVLISPAAGLEVKADDWNSGVYVNNQANGIQRVSIQTPQGTVKVYAGLSWQELDENFGVRLNVADSECGPAARKPLNDRAASLGAVEVKTLDMDLEKYIVNAGWTQDIAETEARLRVYIELPAGSDPAKDYAVISLKANGITEVLGDLDSEPTTITVDSNYFDTFMIVSAPAGTFNNYRVASPNALDKLERPVYIKKLNSTVPAEIIDAYSKASLAVVTDAASVKAAAGGQNVSLKMSCVGSGDLTKKAMNRVVKKTKAHRDKVVVDGKETEKELLFQELEMRKENGERITNTNGKIRITMTVPYNFPAYADYAAAVLNMDGSVSILKDIDATDSTITIDTDQFRTYVLLWGKKGAFDEYK